MLLGDKKENNHNCFYRETNDNTKNKNSKNSSPKKKSPKKKPKLSLSHIIPNNYNNNIDYTLTLELHKKNKKS